MLPNYFLLVMTEDMKDLFGLLTQLQNLNSLQLLLGQEIEEKLVVLVLFQVF
jgi:hypothetical protein